MLCKKIFLTFFMLAIFFTSFGTFNVKKSTSKVLVKEGANFISDKLINNFQGKLIKESGANISGEKISFVDGEFQDAGNKAKITGDLDLLSVAEVILNGLETFKGKRGSAVKRVKINGLFNRLEGILQDTDDIILQDASTSVTCALQGRVPCNIALNGGTLSLEEDLHFADDSFFTGSGTVVVNGRKLKLGATDMTCNAKIYFDGAQDIELQSNITLADVWTFNGASTLEGSGKILDVSGDGDIVVEQGSSLLLDNVTLRGISGSTFACLDNQSTVSFQNVTLILDGDYSFTAGSFAIIDKFHIKGKHTFAYRSSKVSTIHNYGRLLLDKGVTFSYDPLWVEDGLTPDQAKSLIAFEDDTAILELKGANLHVTTTPGLKLTKGTLRVKDHSHVSSELDGQFHMEEGLILGNNDSADDMIVEIVGGASLEVVGGALSYKNVNSSSFDAYNLNSTISIASGAKLKLHQDLDIGTGVVSFLDNSRLARASGKRLLGPVHIFGSVYYEVCYN